MTFESSLVVPLRLTVSFSVYARPPPFLSLPSPLYHTRDRSCSRTLPWSPFFSLFFFFSSFVSFFDSFSFGSLLNLCNPFVSLSPSCRSDEEIFGGDGGPCAQPSCRPHGAGARQQGRKRERGGKTQNAGPPPPTTSPPSSYTLRIMSGLEIPSSGLTKTAAP